MRAKEVFCIVYLQMGESQAMRRACDEVCQRLRDVVRERTGGDMQTVDSVRFGRARGRRHSKRQYAAFVPQQECNALSRVSSGCGCREKTWHYDKEL